MTTEDPGIWRQVALWGWSATTGLIGLVYWNNRAEVASLKEAQKLMISRDEFEKHEAKEDKDRDERRAAETVLFEKSEKLGDKLDDLRESIDNKLTAILLRLPKA